MVAFYNMELNNNNTTSTKNFDMERGMENEEVRSRMDGNGILGEDFCQVFREFGVPEFSDEDDPHGSLDFQRHMEKFFHLGDEIPSAIGSMVDYIDEKKKEALSTGTNPVCCLCGDTHDSFQCVLHTHKNTIDSVLAKINQPVVLSHEMLYFAVLYGTVSQVMEVVEEDFNIEAVLSPDEEDERETDYRVVEVEQLIEHAYESFGVSDEKREQLDRDGITLDYIRSVVSTLDEKRFNIEAHGIVQSAYNILSDRLMRRVVARSIIPTARAAVDEWASYVYAEMRRNKIGEMVAEDKLMLVIQLVGSVVITLLMGATLSEYSTQHIFGLCLLWVQNEAVVRCMTTPQRTIAFLFMVVVLQMMKTIKEKVSKKLVEQASTPVAIEAHSGVEVDIVQEFKSAFGAHTKDQPELQKYAAFADFTSEPTRTLWSEAFTKLISAGKLSSALLAIQKCVSASSSTLTDMKEWMGFNNPCQLHQDVKDWMARVQLDGQPRPTIMHMYEGKNLLARIQTAGLIEPLPMTSRTLFEEFKVLMSNLDSANFASQVVPEPMCIWLYGDGGKGKTVVARAIALELYAKKHRNDRRAARDTLFFQFDPLAKYHTGYVGQPIAIIDDKVASGDERQNEMIHLHKNLVNTNRMKLELPEAQDKKNGWTDFEYVTYVMNQSTFPKAKELGAADRNAVNRRIHVRAKVTTNERRPDDQFNHLVFQCTEDDGIPIGGRMTFAEFMTLCITVQDSRLNRVGRGFARENALMKAIRENRGVPYTPTVQFEMPAVEDGGVVFKRIHIPDVGEARNAAQAPAAVARERRRVREAVHPVQRPALVVQDVPADNGEHLADRDGEDDELEAQMHWETKDTTWKTPIEERTLPSYTWLPSHGFSHKPVFENSIVTDIGRFQDSEDNVVKMLEGRTFTSKIGPGEMGYIATQRLLLILNTLATHPRRVNLVEMGVTHGWTAAMFVELATFTPAFLETRLKLNRWKWHDDPEKNRAEVSANFWVGTLYTVLLGVDGFCVSFKNVSKSWWMFEKVLVGLGLVAAIVGVGVATARLFSTSGLESQSGGNAKTGKRAGRTFISPVNASLRKLGTDIAPNVAIEFPETDNVPVEDICKSLGTLRFIPVKGEVLRVHGLCVGSGIVLTVGHFISQVVEGDLIGTFEFIVDGAQWVVEHSPEAPCVYRIHEEMDLGTLRFKPKVNIPSARSYFQTRDKMRAGEPTMMPDCFGRITQLYTTSGGLIEYRDSKTGGQFMTARSLESFAQGSYNGVCGSPIISVANGKIIGIHCAGERSAGINKIFGTVVELETIAWFDRQSESVYSAELYNGLRDPKMPASMVIVGNTTANCPLVERETRLRPNPDIDPLEFAARVTKSEIIKRPTELRATKGEGDYFVHPMLEGINQLAVERCKPVKEYDPAEMTELVGVVAEWFSEIVADMSLAPVTWTEVIKGTSDGLMGPLDGETSAGINPFGKSRKKDFWKETPTGEIVIDPGFFNYIQNLDNLIQTKRIDTVTSIDERLFRISLKDEKRVVKNNKVKRARVFYACPIALVFLHRRYYHWIHRTIVRQPIRSMLGIGLAPNGVEFQTWANDLEGRTLFDIDFSRHDITTRCQNRVCDIVEMVAIILDAKRGTSHAAPIKNVWVPELHGAIGNMIVLLGDCNPSGIFGTTWRGGLDHILSVSAAIGDVKYDGSYVEGFKELRLGDYCTMCDDGLGATTLSEKELCAVAEHMREHGYTVSNGAKDGAMKHITLKEASFLSRGFRKDERTGLYAPVLKKESIDAISYYWKDSSPGLQLLSTYQGMLNEVALWNDDSMYNSLVEVVQSLASKNHVILGPMLSRHERFDGVMKRLDGFTLFDQSQHMCVDTVFHKRAGAKLVYLEAHSSTGQNMEFTGSEKRVVIPVVVPRGRPIGENLVDAGRLSRETLISTGLVGDIPGVFATFRFPNDLIAASIPIQDLLNYAQHLRAGIQLRVVTMSSVLTTGMVVGVVVPFDNDLPDTYLQPESLLVRPHEWIEMGGNTIHVFNIPYNSLLKAYPLSGPLDTELEELRLQTGFRFVLYTMVPPANYSNGSAVVRYSLYARFIEPTVSVATHEVVAHMVEDEMEAKPIDQGVKVVKETPGIDLTFNSTDRVTSLGLVAKEAYTTWIPYSIVGIGQGVTGTVPAGTNLLAGIHVRHSRMSWDVTTVQSTRLTMWDVLHCVYTLRRGGVNIRVEALKERSGWEKLATIVSMWLNEASAKSDDYGKGIGIYVADSVEAATAIFVDNAIALRYKQLPWVESDGFLHARLPSLQPRAANFTRPYGLNLEMTQMISITERLQYIAAPVVNLSVTPISVPSRMVVVGMADDGEFCSMRSVPFQFQWYKSYSAAIAASHYTQLPPDVGAIVVNADVKRETEREHVSSDEARHYGSMPPRPLSTGAKAIIDLVRVGDQAWSTIMSVLGWCKPNALPSVVNPLRGSNMYFLPTVQDVSAPLGSFVDTQLEHWFDPKEMEIMALGERPLYLGMVTFNSSTSSGTPILDPQPVCPGLTGGSNPGAGADGLMTLHTNPHVVALLPFMYCAFESIELTFRFVLPKAVTGRILFAMSADANVGTGDPFSVDGSSTYTLISLMDLSESRVFRVTVPYTTTRDMLSVGFPIFPVMQDDVITINKPLFFANVATGSWCLYVDQPLLYPTGLSGAVSASVIVEQSIKGLECFGRSDTHVRWLLEA